MRTNEAISRVRSVLRFAILAGGILFAVAVRAHASDLGFLVVGDWGTGGPEQRQVATQMGKAADAIGARFVISTGDNFYPDGVTSVDDPQWKTSFEDIYIAPALRVPWYPVLGNHDHEGNVQAQIDYSERSSRWRMPAPYYKHTERLAAGSHVDFFFLDTYPITRGYRQWWNWQPPGEEQLKWLERGLEESTAQWKIVVAHHPVFSGGRHKNTLALVVLIKRLLERHGVQVYLNGHNHNLEHVVIGDVHYLTSGAGSKPRGAQEIPGSRFVVGDRLGFMTARLSPDRMQIAFVDGKGTRLYAAAIPVSP